MAGGQCWTSKRVRAGELAALSREMARSTACRACANALTALLAAAACSGVTDTSRSEGSARVAALDHYASELSWSFMASEVPVPVTVRALDARGAPVRNASVHWEVSPGNGSLNTPDSPTDTAGIAKTRQLFETLKNVPYKTKSYQ